MQYLEARCSYLDDEKCLPTFGQLLLKFALRLNHRKLKKLILGHYSTRYPNIEKFKTEAKQIFKNVELAKDGLVFKI